MNAMRKGFLLAAIQIVVILSLGAKLLYDRATRPRVWALCQVYDPELPIRGRYLSQQLRVPADGFDYQRPNRNQNWSYMNRRWAHLEVREGKLTAVPQPDGTGVWVNVQKNPDDTEYATVDEPVLIFIPERAQIPHLEPGDEMWVEVTLPAQGPPRPIRLAVKKSGVFTPLKFD